MTAADVRVARLVKKLEGNKNASGCGRVERRVSSDRDPRIINPVELSVAEMLLCLVSLDSQPGLLQG